jgi:hypothetical protein
VADREADLHVADDFHNVAGNVVLLVDLSDLFGNLHRHARLVCSSDLIAKRRGHMGQSPSNLILLVDLRELIADAFAYAILLVNGLDRSTRKICSLLECAGERGKRLAHFVLCRILDILPSGAKNTLAAKGTKRRTTSSYERRGILKEVRSDGSSLFGLPVSDGWYKGEFQSTRPTGTANGGTKDVGTGTETTLPRRRNPGCSKAVLIFSLPALGLYDRTETARDSGGLDVTLAVAY